MHLDVSGNVFISCATYLLPRIMTKLTKTVIEKQAPGQKDIILWDGQLRGFGCKITPKGRRVYFLYYRTNDGRQRRPAIGVHGEVTCENARRIAQQWLTDIANGDDPSGQRQAARNIITVSELMELYMEDRLPHLKPRSKAEIQRIQDKYIIPQIGHMKITHLSRDDIRRLFRNYTDIPYMANRILETISSTFSFAESEGYIPHGSNPCRGIRKNEEKSRERFLNTQEINNLSNVLSEVERNRTESPSVIAAIRLLVFTGCRLNEILTLKWQYVNFENCCLSLPDSKTGAKTVYLSPAALEVLSNIRPLNGNPYVIAGKNENSHLVNLQKPWRRIRSQAGLDDVRIHDLRHTFASVAAANGLSLPIIGALLGHKRAQTTDRYAHLVADPLKEAANTIGSRINSAMSVKETAPLLALVHSEKEG